MKTSDKFLIGLLVGGMLALAGSTRALKVQHDKIAFNDPFNGYTSTRVEPFRVLVLAGKRPGLSTSATTETPSGKLPENASYTGRTAAVLQGSAFEIRSLKDGAIPFTHRAAGDTLFIQYETEVYPQPVSADDAFAVTPFVYVVAPSFGQLTLLGTNCVLTGVKTDRLTLTATGSRVLVDNSTLAKLTAVGQEGSLVQTTATSRIGAATITCRDTSGFVARHDVFGTLTVHADNLARLSIPAALLKKIR